MANYCVKNGIAIIEVNNPPVNALSFRLRNAVGQNLKIANEDPKVKCIVLSGKGRTFLSGADITEFGNLSFAEPTIRDLCRNLEQSRKPTIAAVHGTVFGGGLEVTISCHYRVASKKTLFAFPEVTLGILPAATGTQRFPRLCGLEAALKYIPTGQRFNAAQAQKMGMLDKVADSDSSVLAEAMQFAKTVMGKSVENRIVSKMPVKGAERVRELAEGALRLAAQRSKGLIAPTFCIKSVLAAVQYPFEEGLEKEAEYAQHLFLSGQAKALQYAFFAERAATKWSLPGGANSKNTQPMAVKRSAVIGAGTMGTGIAMALLNAGIPVILLEQNEKFLKHGVSILTGLYEGSVKLGKMTEKQMKMILSQLKPTVRYEDIKDVDFVIEAVYEDMKIKKEVFKKLDSICKPSTILCSNTSYLNIDEIASVTRRPDKVIGTHFFVPAYYMRLLENVRGRLSSPETIATATTIGIKIGKVPVLVGNCHGFCGNRMFSRYTTEAVYLLEEGCCPEEVDQTIEDFGMPIGPLKVSDLSGLDIGWRTRKALAEASGKSLSKKRFINGVRTSYLGDILCENGRLGRKAGKGFYRYERAGAKDAIPDPWVKDLIEQYRRENGIVARRISSQEITERCFYSLINEGFKILEEGIVSKPEEIDAIYLLGYGWPRQTGGPMFYANQVGIKKVYDRICEHYKARPCCPHWQPSDLLRRVAEVNAPMSVWAKHVQSHL